jgi:hypothetical protein
MLTYADVCWRMLTYADVCCRMLTYADVCWRMLTYADIPANVSFTQFAPETAVSTPVDLHSRSYSWEAQKKHVSIRQHTSAYVSIRQHTSAHVSIQIEVHQDILTKSGSFVQLPFFDLFSRTATFILFSNKDVLLKRQFYSSAKKRKEKKAEVRHTWYEMKYGCAHSSYKNCTHPPGY